MFSREYVLKYFESLFCDSSTRLEALITEHSDPLILERIQNIDEDAITYVQLNQMLAFADIPAMHDGFYKYYWITKDVTHAYDVKKIDEYSSINFDGDHITSLEHLRWGIKRIMIDGLLFFGNINAGYAFFHERNYQELVSYFRTKRYDTNIIINRGNPLAFMNIEKADRYLISEMACKTYDGQNYDELVEFLKASYREAIKKGVNQPKIKHLLEGRYIVPEMSFEQIELSTTDFSDDSIQNEDEISEKCKIIAEKFSSARHAAIYNTRLFLSLVHDLDVYMATSMRTKTDFVHMANTCDTIFSADDIKELKLRYFDPTISAAEGHEDKGLIECLMVKCCKVLVYSAGEKESYGKDAEAAMALSLGKPVIFLCENEQRQNFYKNIHPLSRLIDFSTGVANGAIVAKNAGEVITLLSRIFRNDMQYEIKQKHKGYYVLVEKLTDSTIRLQTNDRFLSNAFWSYYGNFPITT